MSKKYSVLFAVFTALTIVTFFATNILFVVGIIKSIMPVIYSAMFCFFLYFVFAALVIWAQACKEVWELREKFGIADKF